MSYKGIVCLLAVVGFAMAAKKMLHPSIITCKNYGPDLSQCTKDNFERLLPLMKDGIPEMNIAPIEPLLVESVRMEFPATRSVSLDANLTNMYIRGISGMVVKEVNVNHDSTTNTYTGQWHFTVPKLSIDSDYSAIGKFLLLAIDTNGNFTGEFEDIDVNMTWTSETFKKNGKEYLKWDNQVESMAIQKMKIHYNNLFPNNTELTENTNKVVNENIEELYNEVSPVIMETFTTVTKSTVNHVYALFPVNDLYLKE